MQKTFIKFSPKRLDENEILDIIENYGINNSSLETNYTKHVNESPWLITVHVNSIEITAEA